jgi:hypothetical protein
MEPGSSEDRFPELKLSARGVQRSWNAASEPPPGLGRCAWTYSGLLTPKMHVATLTPPQKKSSHKSISRSSFTSTSSSTSAAHRSGRTRCSPARRTPPPCGTPRTCAPGRGRAATARTGTKKSGPTSTARTMKRFPTPGIEPGPCRRCCWRAWCS